MTLECNRIRELISDYIDDTLDAEMRAAVEEHISACDGCREELASIRAMVDELGSLEPVKAPGDLLEKIHERMELGYGFHRIVRKLFVPFRIKIPLEFAGAVAVAILVVAVFLNIHQTEEKSPKIPTVSIYGRDVLKPPADRLEKDLKQEAKMSAPVFPKEPEEISGIEDVITPQRSKEAPTKSAVKKEYRRPPSAPEKGRVMVAKQEAKMAAPGLEEPREKRSGIDKMWPSQKSLEVPMKSDVTEELESSPAVSERQKAGKSVRAREPVELVLVVKKELIAGTPQFQMELRSEIRDVPDTSTDNEVRPPIPSSEREMMSMLGQKVIHLINRAKGKVLAAKADRQTGQLNSIDAEIPADRFESFTEGLSRLGTLRTTPPDLSEKDRETLHVRINLESSE